MTDEILHVDSRRTGSRIAPRREAAGSGNHAMCAASQGCDGDPPFGVGSIRDTILTSDSTQLFLEW